MCVSFSIEGTSNAFPGGVGLGRTGATQGGGCMKHSTYLPVHNLFGQTLSYKPKIKHAVFNFNSCHC